MQILYGIATLCVPTEPTFVHNDFNCSNFN